MRICCGMKNGISISINVPSSSFKNVKELFTQPSTGLISDGLTGLSEAYLEQRSPILS